MAIGHGRPRALICWGISLWWAIAAVAAVSSPCGRSHAQSVPSHWDQDVELTDVVFLDPDTGWVVGDRGVILRTLDGGRSWSRVASGVDCRLESIFFLDSQHGWIAGAYPLPLVERSRGIVLRTVDGGRTWHRSHDPALPALRRIRFVNSQQGWALGDSTPSLPAGMLQSQDGGKTWGSIANVPQQQWLAGDRAGEVFVLAGERGKYSRLDGSRFEPAFALEYDRPVLRRLQMTDDRFGWAVGDGGAVLQTRNGGISWEPAIEKTQRRFFSHFDFYALCRAGSQVWLAGSPGTYVFRWNPDDQLWTTHRTPLSTSIRQLFFLDAQRGWAVGDLGTVIATRDGGQTWRILRQADPRVALMQVTDSWQAVGLSLISKYGGEENRLCAVVDVGGAPSEHATTTWFQQDLRLRQAVALAGGSAVACAPTAGQLDNAERLALLVRHIRTYRPSVLVACGQDRSLDALLLAAASDAADPRQHPEQITVAGLRPWAVQQVYSLGQRQSSDESLSHRQYLPGIGQLLEDHMAISRGLLLLRPIGPPKTTLVNLAFASSHGPDGHGVSPGGLDLADTPQRKESGSAAGTLALMRRMSRKQDDLTHLLQSAQRAGNSERGWLDRLQQTVFGLPETTAALWLYQLAGQHLRSGQPELAARTLGLLTEQYPDSPWAPAALDWLWNYYVSDEFAHLHRRKLQRRRDTLGTPRLGVQPAGNRSEPSYLVEDGQSKIIWKPLQQSEPESDPRHQDAVGDEAALWLNQQLQTLTANRLRQAELVAAAMASADPGSVELPRFRLAEALRQTKLADRKSDGIALLRALATDPRSSGDVAAAAERLLQLSAISNTASGPDRFVCASADQRPLLDGELSDPVWQSAVAGRGRLELAPASTPRGAAAGNAGDDARPTIVYLASDQQYLYVAGTCPRLPGYAYRESQQPRPRDPDLTGEDRIELILDLDHDDSTVLVLTLDSRGWVAESCGDNLAWDPSWYVAAGQSADSWTFEAAIPLEEIFSGGADVTPVWSASIWRYADGGAIAAWPAAADAPSAHAQAISLDWPITRRRAAQFALLQLGVPD